MGVSASEMRSLSLWQFQAMLAGWNAAHGEDEDKSLSPVEEDDLFAAVLAYGVH